MRNFWLYAALVVIPMCSAYLIIGAAIEGINEPTPAQQIESLKKYQDLKFENLQKRVKALEEQNKKWMLPPAGKGWEFGK